jgi:hypothetical protein
MWENKNIDLLEGPQAFAARQSDRSSIQMSTSEHNSSGLQDFDFLLMLSA